IVVSAGSVAMAAGLAALGAVRQPWQLYPAFLVMAIGWGAMSGAAIHIILAPWFPRRRGLAVRLAFNGAALCGVVVAPALIPLIGAVVSPRARAPAALVLPVVLAGGVCLMQRDPKPSGRGPEGGPRRPPLPGPPGDSARRWRRDALGTWRF